MERGNEMRRFARFISRSPRYSLACMTKRGLLSNVIAVMAALLALFIGALAARFWLGAENLYAAIRDFMPILIAISAAYLAFCFQRRQAFLVALRELWNDVIETKGVLLEYTHDPAPTFESHRAATKAVARTIDRMRGVYRNVGETRTEVGHYPFEPLHDMRRTLQELGRENPTPERRKQARRDLAGMECLSLRLPARVQHPGATQLDHRTRGPRSPARLTQSWTQRPPSDIAPGQMR
jgi:hypothetical protein